LHGTQIEKIQNHPTKRSTHHFARKLGRCDRCCTSSLLSANGPGLYCISAAASCSATHIRVHTQLTGACVCVGLSAAHNTYAYTHITHWGVCVGLSAAPHTYAYTHNLLVCVCVCVCVCVSAVHNTYAYTRKSLGMCVLVCRARFAVILL